MPAPGTILILGTKTNLTEDNKSINSKRSKNKEQRTKNQDPRHNILYVIALKINLSE